MEERDSLRHQGENGQGDGGGPRRPQPKPPGESSSEKLSLDYIETILRANGAMIATR